jgi:Concanavalin A-like lectin/glucanases superfamily
MAILKNTIVDSTGALQLPVGTTAQRPSSNTVSSMRFNSSFNTIESWTGSRWTYMPDIVRNGLVLNLDAGEPSSYPGSGTTWTDLSGNGNTGTLTNGPTYNSGNGGSIVFDGVDDYVLIGPNLTPSNITLNVWFSPTSTVSGQPIIRYRLYGYGLSIGSNNTISIFLWNSSSVALSLSSVSDYLSVGRVYNAAVTFGNSSLQLYINGILIGSAASTINSIYYVSDGTGLTIGRDGGGTGGFFNGKVYDFMIYNRALTPTEIQQNFNAMRGRFGI